MELKKLLILKKRASAQHVMAASVNQGLLLLDVQRAAVKVLLTIDKD